MLVLIKGAGDLATGTAIRLHRAGFRVVMTDIEAPTAVRRTVAFCQCRYDGIATVEGITARPAADGAAARAVLAQGEIPVLADPLALILGQLPFDAVVDAILAKKNMGTTIADAPIVLALGPGFTAGVDCHGVVETMRGHDLGRLLTQGSAVPNTGVPGDIGGYTTQRIIRASADGIFEPIAQIGQTVREGDLVARVDGTPVYALMDGLVRGMLPAGLVVKKGMKSGDIDPRCEPRHCHTVSDKARAIAGGVLEGLLYFDEKRKNRDGGSATERLIICGGGHVALALAQIGALLEFDIAVIDDRAEFANTQRFPMADRVLALPFLEALDALGSRPEDYYVIVTRGHVCDKDCLAHVLAGRYAYVGMIGSRGKVAAVMSALKTDGVPQEILDGVHSPIGLKIGGQTPAEVAVSIAAELVQIRAALGPKAAPPPEGAGVLCTIVKKTGSAPRGVGAWMLVGPGGNIEGTIGGGAVEFQAAKDARALLTNGGAAMRKSYDLGPNAAALGMVCGGKIDVEFTIRK